MRKLAFICLALTLAAAGCSSSGGESDESASGAESTKTAEPPKLDKEAYATDLEEAYVVSNGRPIEDSCDDAFTNWQCFYDGIDVTSESFITIELSTPGDVSKAEAEAFSKQARLAWFNFVGTEFENLDTVVTYVNGSDTGTTRRDQVPLLNR